jgi:hypothetical protein
MRILLVDGPQHGNSVNVEGTPDDLLYFPDISYHTYTSMDNEEATAFMKNYRHVYQFRDKTQQTLIYHYRGSK